MRIGFSLDDVKRMSVADMVAFADVASEGRAKDRPGGGARRATQADIDRLLG